MLFVADGYFMINSYGCAMMCITDAFIHCYVIPIYAKFLILYQFILDLRVYCLLSPHEFLPNMLKGAASAADIARRSSRKFFPKDSKDYFFQVKFK
jgi:hypothetical protein